MKNSMVYMSSDHGKIYSQNEKEAISEDIFHRPSSHQRSIMARREIQVSNVLSKLLFILTSKLQQSWQRKSWCVNRNALTALICKASDRNLIPSLPRSRCSSFNTRSPYHEYRWMIFLSGIIRESRLPYFLSGTLLGISFRHFQADWCLNQDVTVSRENFILYGRTERVDATIYWIFLQTLSNMLNSLRSNLIVADW